MDDNRGTGRSVRREPGKYAWQGPDATHCISNARSRIDAGVPVAYGTVDDGKSDNDRAYHPPVFLAQVRPGSSRCSVTLDSWNAPAIYSSKGGHCIEQANGYRAVDNRARNVAFGIMCFFAQWSCGFEAHKGQKGKDHTLKDACQSTQPIFDAINGGKNSQVIMRAYSHDHGKCEGEDDAEFNCSQDHACPCRELDPVVRQGKDSDVSQDRVNPPGDIDACECLNKRFSIKSPDERHQGQQERLGDEKHPG